MLQSTVKPSGISKRAHLLKAAKRRLMRMHFESGVGHIGGNLSALDILLAVYHDEPMT